ncbi:MAG: AAA family ATPase [Schwartzia sp.]|nr:AAA family ATPase [Schwartzia sp. (in: firmicutes)]
MDEAGMIDNNSLFEFFKMAEAQRAAGAEIKIVMVGDDRQLPPVGAGNFFSDAIQRETIATAELTDIRRQEGAPELLQAVREAVQGSPEKSLEFLTNADAIHEIKTPKGRTSAIVKEYMSMSDAERGETLILTAKNADRRRINNTIRDELVKAGKINQGKAYTVEVRKGAPTQTRNFAAGDKIVFLKNDIRAGVQNGTQGTIEQIKGDRFKVKTAAGKTVNIDIKQYNRIDHAYCMTTHKSQGATVQRVIVNINSSDKALNTRNSYYVDISRAKSKVSLYCDSKKKIGAQVQHFAKKLTAKDFTFTKPTAAPIRAIGATTAIKTAIQPTAAAGKTAGKAVESVAALVPPIPIIKTILEAATKMAAVAAEAVSVAMKPLDMAAGMVRNAAETGINEGFEVDMTKMERERTLTQ